MPNGIPVGTVPIRNYLRSMGVPDSMIQWDQESQTVRVGNQTIRPEVNIQGRTYATPQALQEAIEAVNNVLLTPPQTQSSNPFQGPQSPDVSLMNTFASMGQALPAFEGLLRGIGQLPLTPDATAVLGAVTGRTPTGAPTFDAQQAIARSFADLGNIAGQFGQTPTEAGMFAELLSQFAGQQTEQRRANLAREALQRESINLQREQLMLERASEQALTQFAQDLNSGMSLAEATTKAIAAGAKPSSLATTAGLYVRDQEESQRQVIRGIQEAYGVDTETAIKIGRVIDAPTSAAAFREYLAIRREILSDIAAEGGAEAIAAIQTWNQMPDVFGSTEKEEYLDRLAMRYGYDLRSIRRAIEQHFGTEGGQ